MIGQANNASCFAIAVVLAARDEEVGRHLLDDEVEPAVDVMMWEPGYLPYEPV